jgi:hypothetical protein
MNRAQLLERLDLAWAELGDSFAGLSEAAMAEPGVVGDWSVKDLLGHVTTWEEEALKALPALMEGQKSLGYSRVNRFNAEQVEHKKGMALAQVLREMADPHGRIMALARGVAERHFERDTPFRQRLRWDAYSHYREHARAILAWRAARGL